jgi:hypothetical protein
MAAASGIAAPGTNVSAAAYAWLSRTIRNVNPDLWDSWWQPVEALVNKGNPVFWSESWPHDFWVAQGVRYLPGGSELVQMWHHQRPLDDWPLLGLGAVGLAPDGTGQTPNVGALDRILASASALSYEHDRHLARFNSYLDGTVPVDLGHGRLEAEPRHLKASVVRAWLDSVLGSSLAGLVLSPTDDAGLLGPETWHRLEVAWRFGAGSPAPQINLSRAIEALYATQWENGQPALMPTQQGQALWMRDHWFWLGQSLEAGDLREAVQVTAGLLVSPPLAGALLDAVGGGNDTGLVALCVLRRWALGLRAMAWLEEATGHEWRDVRLSDVVSFAYAAIAPWWPRPSNSISHRSADAKPILKDLRIWRNAQVAIDAMVIPGWESNTGFVWRLFAATPTIIRVQSASYRASTWCRREDELTRYLVEHCDFLRGRVVADADVTQLPVLDRAAARLSSAAQPDQKPSAERRPDFPPATLVLEVPSCPPLIIKLLAAVCTLRLLNGLIGNVDTVNVIVRLLTTGQDIRLRAPTNDPGGWAMHYEAFRALAEYSRTQTPIRLVSGYPELQRQLDLSEVVQRIPDLRGGSYSGIDLLASLEWNREIRRWFTERWDSRLVIVDCRNVDAKRWPADESYGIQRGIIALRTESEVLIVQNAGQDVNRWPVIESRNSPILTQHVAGQLRWMARASMLPTWIVAYLSLPDFEFEPDLVRAMVEALADEFVEDQDFTLPSEYSDVFVTDVGPDSPFYETLNWIHPGKRDTPG